MSDKNSVPKTIGGASPPSRKRAPPKKTRATANTNETNAPDFDRYGKSSEDAGLEASTPDNGAATLDAASAQQRAEPRATNADDTRYESYDFKRISPRDTDVSKQLVQGLSRIAELSAKRKLINADISLVRDTLEERGIPKEVTKLLMKQSQFTPKQQAWFDYAYPIAREIQRVEQEASGQIDMLSETSHAEVH